MYKKYYFSILLLLISLSTFATVIKGKVIDENDMPVSFATILVKNTTIGTSANNSGEYQLDLKPGSYTIICKTIGYQAFTKTITIGEKEETLNFKLVPQNLKLSEVVISAKKEDPAYPIMRKVIAKRKIHADLVKTLESDIYLKGVMRSRSFPDNILGFSLEGEEGNELKSGFGVDSMGKGILYLVEEMSHYYYKAPNKMFHEIISVRESGDPKGLGFATMPPITNIYENNIQILSGLNERGFISPANSNAFQYYNYKFLGTFMEDDYVINKIKITPKRKYEPLFSGYLYVVEDEWVFHSVDLLLTKESQINTLDTLKFEQSYRPLAKDIWVIQSQVLYPTFKIIGIDFAGNFVTSYSNQKLNQPISEEKINSKTISKYEKTAMESNPEYWDTIRPIPLEKDEIKDYVVKDSIHIAQKLKTDSLEKTSSISYDLFLKGFYAKFGKNTISTRPLLSSIWFNSVEGLNAKIILDYKYKFTKYSKLDFQLINRYGFANEHYNVLAKLGMSNSDSTWTGKSWSWQATAGKYIYQINPENPIGPVMDGLYTLFGGRNYMKLFENKLAKINLKRNWGNGLDANITVSYEQRIPLFNASDFTFINKHDERITPNQPANLPDLKQEDAAIIAASISYQPGWQYIEYPDHKAPISSNLPRFTVNYTKGIPGIFNSVSNFDKWSVDMSHQFRLHMLGNLNYRLETGGFLNNKEVNLPDYKHLNGNQTFLANSYLNAFQLAPYYRYSNTADVYFQGHLEWHLGGLFTNKIPLFKRLNWFLLGGSNVLYINETNYYAEVFVGLENIGVKMFRFGRVDFIAGYESGLSKPSLGVRISFGNIFESLLGMQENTEL